MTPSLPPGVQRKPVLETGSSPAWNAAGAWLRQHQFALIFGLIFTAKSAARLLKHSTNQRHRQAAALATRILRRLSDEWFGLVVANAFTAFWLTLAIQCTQTFTWRLFFWHLLAEFFRPALHALAGVVPGSGFFGDLFTWYQDNQLKFTFWILYSGAICDDLGLPNYKSLGRWIRRRFLAPAARPENVILP